MGEEPKVWIVTVSGGEPAPTVPGLYESCETATYAREQYGKVAHTGHAVTEIPISEALAQWGIEWPQPEPNEPPEGSAEWATEQLRQGNCVRGTGGTYDSGWYLIPVGEPPCEQGSWSNTGIRFQIRGGLEKRYEPYEIVELEPLPCPFCGSEAYTPQGGAPYVLCRNSDCSVAGPTKPTEAAAVVAWNRAACAMENSCAD